MALKVRLQLLSDVVLEDVLAPSSCASKYRLRLFYVLSAIGHRHIDVFRALRQVSYSHRPHSNYKLALLESWASYSSKGVLLDVG